MWVLDHLDDIESDMSAIHRIDDMFEMPSRRFFCFAERLHAYRGVLRLRAELDAENEDQPTQAPVQQDPRATEAPEAPAEKKIYVKDIHLNPELMPYFEGPEDH